MPLPTPRSVISSPSHMMTAVPAVMQITIVVMVKTEEFGIRLCAAGDQVARPGQRDDAGGLQDGQADGQVPGVLRDLRLAGLALLAQRLQARDDHREQLQDDAGRDVRHDAEREDRQLQQRAAAEQVDQLEQVGLAGRGAEQAWTARSDTPGVGSEEPSRNTAMMKTVKSSFLRRSGVLNARMNAVSMRSPLLLGQPAEVNVICRSCRGPAAHASVPAAARATPQSNVPRVPRAR